MKDSLAGILSNRGFQVVFLMYSSLLVFLGRQLDRGITNFDDAYYAQKAKEIFSSDSLWVVMWKGTPFVYDNPPMPFWLTGLAFKFFGVSGYAAVFSSAIFGTLTVYLTYSMCSYLFKNNWMSFLAAFVLLFPGMFLDSSRRGMLDITLAFFVTAAMYCLIKGLENKKYFLLYGLMTGFAVLTKSVLGFFPVVVGVVFMFWHGGLKKLFDPMYIAGVVVSLVVGCSWFVVNWQMFGDLFLQSHFKSSHMKIIQDDYLGGAGPMYLLGYLKDMLKNYWPWFPFVAVGMFLFARRGFRERDVTAMFLFLWVLIPFVIMSTSRNQTLRYLMIVSHTIAGWLKDDHKEKSMPWMIGIVMVTVLVVNVTPIQVKVSLTYNSPAVRDIAPFVRMNTQPGEDIFNYKFSPWNPTQALAFYSDRFLKYPVNDPKTLFEKLDSNPEGTWLSSISEFKALEEDFPGKLYLIYGNQRFAYFTSMKNRENVVYDFSSIKQPVVR